MIISVKINPKISITMIEYTDDISMICLLSEYIINGCGVYVH